MRAQVTVVRAIRTGESSVSSNRYKASSSERCPTMYVFARAGIRFAREVMSWCVGVVVYEVVCGVGEVYDVVCGVGEVMYEVVCGVGDMMGEAVV